MSLKLTYSEEELVASLRNKDEKSFGYLYDKYSKALLGVIIHYVPVQEEAEDVLQNVFVKIWNHIGDYDSSKGRLYTWMLNISRNASIDYTRSKENKNNRKNQSIDNIVYAANNQFQHNENYDHIGLSTLVGKLKEEHQKMIDLAYFKGFTHEEIAKNLEMPLGTVKTRIRQAIMSLRELIK